jgi:hypothetical protein
VLASPEYLRETKVLRTTPKGQPERSEENNMGGEVVPRTEYGHMPSLKLGGDNIIKGLILDLLGAW